MSSGNAFFVILPFIVAGLVQAILTRLCDDDEPASKQSRSPKRATAEKLVDARSNSNSVSATGANLVEPLGGLDLRSREQERRREFAAKPMDFEGAETPTFQIPSNFELAEFSGRATD